MRNAWPVAFLVLVTPCVEFLTGSTSLGAVLTTFPAAFTFFVITWPTYALPVLLIREALVAWNKGVASLLALGIAYGALNEGLLAKTYFAVTPTSPPLGGGLGEGRWLGVNWPWVTEITLFHMIVSISVPVTLSFLLFPRSRQERFLSERTIRVFVAVILAEVLGILAVESLFSPAIRGLLPSILLPAGIVLIGVQLARRLPRPSPERLLPPRLSRPLPLVLASVAFFVVTFAPILTFFPVAFVPDANLAAVFYRAVPDAAIVATVYPLLLAYLAVRFFATHTLTDRQLLAVVTGVLLVPLGTALSLHDLPQGDWAAAGVYIASLGVAARRLRLREALSVPPPPARTASG